MILLAGCTRAATPATDAATSPLDGCITETRDSAVTYSCGAAFLAMDATVNERATEEAIAKNLEAFVEPFGHDVVSRSDAPLTAGAVAHRAVRVHVDLPDKGKFVAMMVVVARSKTTRVLTCSAKEAEAQRCDDVLAHLATRAMSAP